MTLIFSSGIKRIPFLDIFLSGPGLLYKSTASETPVSQVAVWGGKDNYANSRAKAFAADKGLPLIYLEDGFLRSLDLGGKGAPPLSLIVDKTGIYYDASRPSDLENLLNDHGWETPALLAKAQAALNLITAAGLSKYNHAPEAPPDLLGGGNRRKVLIIDQTYGDKSVELGLATPETFQLMLAEAVANHPEADIFIKTHPDVIAGKKKGYLNPAKTPGIRIISSDYNPLSLLKQVDEVYTATSQMGFEALFLGKPVHCFGLPFYSGWGLTEDKLKCSRRTAKRSLLELFAAAYLLYPRYVNPITGERVEIDDIIRLLTLQRNHNELNRGHLACVGFSWWKHGHARAFLRSTTQKIRFFKNMNRALGWVKANNGRLVVWSSKISPELKDAIGDTPLIRMEDGFLRSVGLGSDFNQPYSLVLDAEGIYYDPRTPSGLETILNHYDFSLNPDLLPKAAQLRRLITARGLSKYNVGRQAYDTGHIPEGKKIILVPGQVEDDASVRRGSAEVDTNLKLLKAVRAKRPDDFIIYKIHPDVERRNRKGAVNHREALQFADQVVQDTHIEALLRCAREVHTLTSLVGFEALLRDLPVYTYGGPFYAGWGLTDDEMPLPGRTRKLSLDELTAATLILYPSYYDWPSRMFCGPEDIVHRLATKQPIPKNFMAQILWALREAFKSLVSRGRNQ